MTAPVTTDGRPIVGAYGDIYTAPVGTPQPTNIDTPGSPWTKLGLVSADGATWTPPAEETTDIGAWQSKYPIRTITTALTTSLAFALMEWDRDTIPFALGGGEFTDDAGGTVTYHPPAPGESESRALFIKVLDTPIKMGIYYPKGRITGRDDTVFNGSEAALLNVTYGIEGDINIVDPYTLVFEDASFPPAGGTAATTATAGTPGSFNGTPPADLAALQSAAPPITASPTTAWTTGQYVALGDASHAHWTSTAWAAGDAP